MLNKIYPYLMKLGRNWEVTRRPLTEDFLATPGRLAVGPIVLCISTTMIFLVDIVILIIPIVCLDFSAEG